MKKAFITLLLVALYGQLGAQNYQRTPQGVKADVKSTKLLIPNTQV